MPTKKSTEPNVEKLENNWGELKGMIGGGGEGPSGRSIAPGGGGMSGLSEGIEAEMTDRQGTDRGSDRIKPIDLDGRFQMGLKALEKEKIAKTIHIKSAN